MLILVSASDQPENKSEKPPDNKITVAVYPIKITGADKSLEPVLTSLYITKLSESSRLKVVEEAMMDEVLKRFLGYDVEALEQLTGGHLASDGGPDTITVRAGQAAWTVRPSLGKVVIEDGASENPRVAVQAAPDPMLRWLWGRAGDDAVRLTGEEAWAGYLRRMLATVTQ